MIKKTLKTSEFNHFETLADEWWDPDGKFKILHLLTPIRIKYIKNKLFEKKQRSEERRVGKECRYRWS